MHTSGSMACRRFNSYPCTDVGSRAFVLGQHSLTILLSELLPLKEAPALSKQRISFLWVLSDKVGSFNELPYAALALFDVAISRALGNK